MSEAPDALPQESVAGAGIRLVVFDFDGVFTDNAVWTASDGTELVRSWRGDGLGLSQLRELKIPVWVLSTETDPVVVRRCEKLGIPCSRGLSDKREALVALAADVGVGLGNTAYVGNDVNDAECLRAVGVPIVVADAHRDVLGLALYRTRAAGGQGAVREVCDWIATSVRMHAPVPQDSQ
jgi:3-deoxy-D-manno-octulosonate 8-phosphate phosphatase (KDO 8-P phosphatase)